MGEKDSGDKQKPFISEDRKKMGDFYNFSMD
jgi:hypothetical protein